MAGKTLSRKVSIYINGKEIESTLSSLQDNMRKLQAQQRKMTIGSEEYIETSMKIREIDGVIREQQRAVKDLGNSWDKTSITIANVAHAVMGLQSVMQMFDAGVGKLKDLAADAAALDDVYADVQKTTGLTHEEVEKLNEAFKKMDTRTSREQLNQLAYEAGKLGISSQEQVAQFVSASDKINIALGDVLGEGAMVKIGKLSDVYAKSTQQLAAAGDDLEAKMLKIGSAVNMLGQSSTANEGYLVEFLSRMGGIATQANLSADAILGFASALDQDMQKQEMSATAFQKFIMQMIKKPAEFASAARMEVKEFTELMQQDMNEALLRVLEGFKGQGGLVELQPIFQDLGLDAARAASVISSMANSVDKIREAQAIANDELTTGASVINEFNTKNNNMQAQAEKAKKAFEDVRIELGNELYPVLVSMTKVGTGLTKGLAGFVRLLKENHIALAGVVALLARYAYLKGAAYLATVKLQKQLKSLLGIEKLEAMQKEIANAKQLKKIAADEKERLAEIKLELAKQKQIAAMKVEANDYGALTVKTLAQGRAQQLEAAATKQAEVATKANTAATNAQKAAFASTPWGLIITALTSIAALTWQAMKNSSQWKLDETLKSAAKQAGEAEGKIRALIGEMQNASVGSEAYRKALDELKKEYPEIIAQHIDATGAVRNLESAYKDLSKAARNSVYEMMFTEAVGTKRGELAEQLQDTIDYMGKFIDGQAKELARKGYKSLSQAELGMLKRQINSILVDMSESSGLVGAQSKIDNLIGKAFGVKNYQMGFMPGLKKLSEKAKETTEYIEGLKTEMDFQTGVEKDPFGVQNMNLKQLNEQLETSQRLLKSYQKAADEDRQGFSKKAENERQKIEAINAQITKLRNTEKEAATSTTPSLDSKADKAKQAWKSFCNEYERLMAKIDTKTKTGIAKTLSEVDDGIAKMRQQLESKEVNHPDAAQKLADLVAAAERWKQSEIDKYIKKANEELAKLQAQHKGTSDIEAVNKVTEAYERLKNEIAKANEQINQYEQDLTDPNLSEEAKAQIQAIINGYRQGISDARVELIKTIDGSSVDVSGFTGSNEGKRQQIAAEYKKQSDAIAKAKESNEALLEILRKQLATEQAKSEEQRDPAVVDALDAQIAALERQNTVLDENKNKLDKANESKEQLLDTEEWSTKFRKVTEILRNFADSAMETMQQLNDYLDNKSNRRIQDAEKERDAKIEALDEQLKNNIISDEQYTERKEAIEKEYNEKRKAEELEQFKRQKAMSLAQAHMSAALAVIQVWADSSLNTWAKIAMSAIAATNVALQTAAILAEPEPYAKGGYVPRETVFKAGEAGEEWVASNDLLTDPSTAPVIAALEKYQRGDTSLLQRLPFARVNTANVSAAAQAIDGRLSASRTAAQTDNSQMVALLQELCAYMKDPNNRRAVISRDYQMTYERNENFLRNMARL